MLRKGNRFLTPPYFMCVVFMILCERIEEKQTLDSGCGSFEDTLLKYTSQIKKDSVNIGHHQLVWINQTNSIIYT